MAQNSSFTMLASAARTADTSYEFRNHTARGLMFVVDCTVDPSTAAITPRLQVKDESGTYTSFWSAAATVAAVGVTTYLLYPGAIAADFDGTEAVSIAIPQECRLFMDAADAESITYSVRGHLIS